MNKPEFPEIHSRIREISHHRRLAGTALDIAHLCGAKKYSFYAIERSWDEALSICLRFALAQSEKKVLECTEDGKY